MLAQVQRSSGMAAQVWGRLIVFEGVEGCGKSTQLQRVEHWLVASGWTEQLRQGQSGRLPPILVTREPGGTPLGNQLRQLLLNVGASACDPIQAQTELLLYAADRVQHVATVLRPHLQEGTLVLCDRYTDSTVAYQGYGRGLDLAMIHQLNQFATGGLSSDLTLWLDLEVEQGLARARQRSQPQDRGLDRMELGTLAFHHQIQAGFRSLAQQFPERIVRIDASPEPEQVTSAIQAVLEPRLQEWYPRRSHP